jgi:hypothetical protein
MTEPDEFCAAAVKELEMCLEHPPAPPSLIGADERRALYAREMLWRFECDPSTYAAAERAFWRRRPELEELILTRGQWDGAVRSLEDALMLGYSGFAGLEQFENFADDLRTNVSGSLGPLSEASEVCLQAGLRCGWAGPALVAAWLCHVMWNLKLPAHMARERLQFWPEAGRTVLDTVPQVHLAYDPTAESRSSFSRRARKAAGELARSTTQRYLDTGHIRFADAERYRRDVFATFVRINDPTTWTWRRIAEVFGSNWSVGAAQAAVRRVTTLLDLEIPRGRPGRPRRSRS